MKTRKTDKRKHSEKAAAVKTLERKGYTYNGGELWKPPLGKPPDFDLLDYWKAKAGKAESLLQDARKKIAELGQGGEVKELPMNAYEKHSLLADHIQDMEKRLGAYLWMPGCEKTDRHARCLIYSIKASRDAIAEMLNRPV